MEDPCKPDLRNDIWKFTNRYFEYLSQDPCKPDLRTDILNIYNKSILSIFGGSLQTRP